MIGKKWLGTCGRVVSFSVAFLIAIATLGNEIHAQSVQPEVGGSVLKPASPPAFVVAPSMLLGYSPTSMAAAALTSSGRVDLITADRNIGKITVFVSLGHGTFAPGNTYAAGTGPVSLVVADIDGDGKPDVLLANPSEGVISFFAGNGDGTLGARRTFAIGFAPSLIAVGDFTGNGKLDIAVAGAAAKTLAVLQNDGAGNLKRPVNFSLDSTPAAVIAADFNHDGHMDLAIANSEGTVSVLLGKGNGQFSVPADMSVSSGPLTSIAAADFNRDGNADLVVTASATNQAAVLLGHGDGTFASPKLLEVGDSPVAAHVADVDGDGVVDLIIINKGSNTFSVLNGVGDGTFKDAAHFVVGNAPLGGAAADLYGSGHVDLATINQVGQTLSVPAGNGDGTFAAGRAYVAGVQPVAVAAGDLTANGETDVVVANYCGADATCGGSGSAAVLQAGPGGVYQLASMYAMGTGSVAIHLIDVNGDGKADLVALNRVDKSVSVRLGAGDGTFGNLITIPLAGAPVALAAADFNKDGKTDLAVLTDCGAPNCPQPGEVEFLLGSGDGNFHSLSSYPVGYGPVALASGKISASGNSDVVVANRCGSDARCQSAGIATILLGDGTGAFKAGTDVTVGNSPSSIALADLRGSGIQDLVVSRSVENTIAVLPGDGKGSFGAAVPYAVGHAPGKVVVADFNGDGRLDVAVANAADSTVSVLFGQKDGTLQPAFAVPVSGNPSALAAIAGATPGAPASLATTNGSTSSPVASSNVTVISNLNARPMVSAGGGSTPSTTTLSSGTNPSTVNQGVQLTATVTGVTGSGLPTGNVIFYSDGTGPTNAVSDCGGTTGLAVNGSGVTATVSCTTSVLTASSAGHSLTAHYAGDGTYDVSDSTAVNQVVNLATTTLTIAAPGTPSPVNTAVTFTATLHGTFTPTVPTTGSTTTSTIAFFADGSTTPINGCGAAELNFSAGAYTATCSTDSLHGGSHNISATYSGDSNFSMSNTSTSASYTVNKGDVTLAVTGPTVASPVNSNVTVTGTLTGTFTPIAPGGSIAFVANASTNAINLCTSAVGVLTPPGSYGATCQTQALISPNDVISATYAGNGDFNAQSQSTNATVPVSKGTPTTTIVLPSSAPVTNQPFTISAQVTDPTGTKVNPSGTVTFNVNGTPVCTNAGLSSSIPPTANCAYSAGYTAGTPLTTSYLGDTDFGSSTGTGNLVVNTATTQTAISTPGPSTINQQVTVSTTITPQFPGKIIPQGTVTFSTTGSTSATDTCAAGVKINADGTVPNCNYTFLAASPTGSPFTISATYVPPTGDLNFKTSNAAQINQIVNPGNASLALATTAPTPSATSFVNQRVTFAATFTTTFTGTPPSGTMTYADQFTSPATTLCTKTVTKGSIPTCDAVFTAAGPHPITATYSNDPNFNPGSAAITQTVKADTSSTALDSSVKPSSRVNQVVTFTATVTPTDPGTQTSTGTVTFTATASGSTTATVLCPAVKVQNGLDPTNTFDVFSATCQFNSPGIGSYSIGATFSGDGNFSAGTQTTFTQQVVQDGIKSVTVNPSPANSTASLVNQGMTFAALITPNDLGGISPGGSVTFTDSDGTTQPCSPVQATPNTGLQGTSMATCKLVFLKAGSHVVTATYGGDSNFDKTGAAGNSNGWSVEPSATSTMVGSSPNPSFAYPSTSSAAAVTFTAIVTPTPAFGPTLSVPTGKVQFVSDSVNLVLPAACGSAPLNPSPANDGTAVATCSMTFTHQDPLLGEVRVNGQYMADANFAASPVSTDDVQTVQDFKTGLSVTPSSPLGDISSTNGVYLTQGYSTTLNSANTQTNFGVFEAAVITAPITTSTAYNPTMIATCQVFASSDTQRQNPLTDPACTTATSPQAFQVKNNAAAPAFEIAASQKAPTGSFTVVLTVNDPNFNTGVQTQTFPLYVIAPVTTTLSATLGSSATQNVSFNTTSTTLTFSCPYLWSIDQQQMVDNTKSNLLTCALSNGTSVQVNGDLADAGITFTPVVQTSSNARSSSTLYAATFLSIPLLAVLTWIGSRKSPRRNLFRFLGMILLLAGLSCITACGGGFTTVVQSPPPQNGLSGNYLIQVQAQDGSGNTFYAVLPMQVLKP